MSPCSLALVELILNIVSFLLGGITDLTGTNCTDLTGLVGLVV